jgi:hypothetical protein
MMVCFVRFLRNVLLVVCFLGERVADAHILLGVGSLGQQIVVKLVFLGVATFVLAITELAEGLRDLSAWLDSRWAERPSEENVGK